ncbi:MULTISPECIES: membrane protein [unclassified Rhodococcus (in: high G+C Gram-positive bacteria)]|uniref:membrane protein n=1 Tax=unclassified Rhodococcus (in: high G+C Gram-positive bacteria) TaxID=192944 RepID=UPI0002DA5C89|nr:MULTISPECIES: membrane protein [unclassified Rhodococcus (in: high G+C Gram-positive bacteria)]WAM20018.1 hypothetical protein OYT95_41015 [Rhodococcus sp. JS3073]
MVNDNQIAPTTKFEQTLRASAQMPGVRIDRKAFLRSELKRFCSDDQIGRAIATTPAEAGVPLSVIDQIANSVINYETGKVTTISAVAGIPGGFVAFGTIPADIAQYYGHLLRVVQKLAYIYSWPDLFDDDGDGMDAATESMLTLFIGVMFGVNAAQAGVAQVSALIAKQVAKKLPQQALTKGTVYPIVKKVATVLGVQMTKQIFAKSAAKIVPLVGAVVSGSLTFATFLPMSKRLRKHLASLPLTKPSHVSDPQSFGRTLIAE